MKITAVHVDTLELTMEEPFVIASSAMAYGPCEVNIALANAVHGDAELPWRQGALEHDLGRGIKQEVVDGVSWIEVPDGPGLGIELIEENVDLQRVARRW